MANSQGLVIAGYYSAEENYNDISNDTGMRIVNKIGEFYPAACLVTVRTSKIVKTSY